MTANLDAQFGHCVTPVRINIAEGNHYPSTLFSLNGQTAPRLRRFIDMSSERDRFANFAFQDFAILWVVNASGEILIAIEEGVVLYGTEVTFPLPIVLGPSLAQIPSYSKLGHPALVACQGARIAGEILCDFDQNSSQWYINNRSGRYGLNLGRTPQQLANVATEFAQFGIVLQQDFI
jgi:hypothetical protein